MSILLAATLNKTLLKCPQVFNNLAFQDYKSKDQIVKTFLSKKLQEGNEFHADCPIELVKSGMFEAAEYLIKEFFIPRGENIENNFHFQANSMKSKLENLHKLSMQSSKPINMQPAFKWGQSQEQIIMFIKFANRLDSPGCFDISNRQIEVIDDVNFFLKGTGILAGSLVSFGLEFPLFTEVWPSSIKVENAGVGSVTVSFKKRRMGIWPQLWKAEYPKIPKTAIWWDLKGKEYDKAMYEFSLIHQKLENQKDGDLWHNKKKKEEEPNFLAKIWRGAVNLFKGWFTTN